MKPWSSPKVIWLKHSIIIDMNTIGLILHSYGKWPIEIYGLWLFNMFYLLNIVIFHGYVNQMVSDMDKYGPTQLVMFSNDMFWTTFNNHQQSMFKSLYFKSPQPYPPAPAPSEGLLKEIVLRWSTCLVLSRRSKYWYHAWLEWRLGHGSKNYMWIIGDREKLE